MATVATWTQAWDAVKYCVKAWRETRELAGINADNLDGIEADLRDNIRGNNRDRIVGAIAQRRAGIEAELRNVRGWVGATLWELRDVVGSKKGNARGIVEDVRDVMTTHNTSGATVPSRNVTTGASTSGATNVAKQASGADFMFITYDRYGFKIEDGLFGPKVVAEVQDDSGTAGVASGAEIFRVFTSGVLPRDSFVSGTALARETEHRARAAEDPSNVIGNGNFKVTASGQTHPYQPWFTSNSSYTGITSFQTSAARIVRGSVGTTELCGDWRAIAISGATNALVQKITTAINPDRPYPRYIWYRGIDGWDGTLVFKFGSHRLEVSGSLDTWSVLATSGATSSAKNLYYENFRTNPLLAEVWVNGRTTGAVLISTCYAGPADYFNGRFFIFRPGRKDLARKDQWSWTDTETNSNGIQGVMNRSYPSVDGLPGIYFHHVGSGSTISDPS